MVLNMTVETKFNIKDHAYAIIENKVKYVDICNIVINVDYNFNTNIQYNIEYWSYNKRIQNYVDEKYLFPTKEELIKSL
jgi:hypothetical protein